MQPQRINLLGLDDDALTRQVEQWGGKPFRAKQLMQWVHQRGVGDFDAMTDLAKDFRQRLNKECVVQPSPVLTQQRSSDGTRKWLFDVGQGNAIESVFIPEDDRGTLCVSSQAGCNVACRFCSTGHQGFSRNLTTAEIIGQLWWARHELMSDVQSARIATRAPADQPSQSVSGTNPGTNSGTNPGTNSGAKSVTKSGPNSGTNPNSSTPIDSDLDDSVSDSRVISNVVMMGMGEPLLNYDPVLSALRIMLDDRAYGLSRRRVTLSTSGVVPMMDRLSQDCPVALAVSLHAPNDALRDQLVPLNKKYPLDELLAACERYLAFAPRDFITFEYVMLDGVNDSDQHAKELIEIARRVHCKFNLIPFNPFPGSGLKRSTDARIRIFSSRLMDAGLVTTVRKTRGDDIDAACGQLAGEVQDRTRIKEKMSRQSIIPVKEVSA